MKILRSNSGSAKLLMILLLLAGTAYWYRNYSGLSSKSASEVASMQAPVPAAPKPLAPAEPAEDTAQNYARKHVSFTGVVGEGKLEKPGLILTFDNRGDRDLSNLSVQITGYTEFYVQDTSKANGTEYVVELEVKNFPAKKRTETVLYFPPGVQSIAKEITIYDATFGS